MTDKQIIANKLKSRICSKHKLLVKATIDENKIDAVGCCREIEARVRAETCLALMALFYEQSKG